MMMARVAAHAQWPAPALAAVQDLVHPLVRQAGCLGDLAHRYAAFMGRFDQQIAMARIVL